MSRRLLIFLIFIVVFLASCGIPASDSPKPDSAILTSTTFLADIARNVAGDRVNVTSLLPTGADPHSYQPSPQDIAKVANTKLLIINGVGYETFLQPLLDNTGGEANVVEASAGIDPRKDANLGLDPHLWLDPTLVIKYVENIRIALTEYDPQGALIYQTNADTYTAKLHDLDTWIQNEVSNIPSGQRILVTNHESLNYFAERYGFKVAGSVVPGFSTNASPSAQEMAVLIDKVKQLKVHAIFLDASDNNALAKQISGETGIKVISDLYLESLTNGAPAATYIDMMKYDVSRIVKALK